MSRRARSLATFLAQLDARFPNRSKRSDGWIASAAHLDRTGAGAAASQHNPNRWDVVCAIDVTEDLSVGLDCDRLMDELDALDDPRVFYTIHAGEIENSDDTRTPYRGSNRHDAHLHLSVRYTDPALFDDPAPWRIPMLTGAPAPRPPEDDMYGQAQRDEAIGRLDTLIGYMMNVAPAVGRLEVVVNDPTAGVGITVARMAGEVAGIRALLERLLVGSTSLTEAEARTIALAAAEAGAGVFADRLAERLTVASERVLDVEAARAIGSAATPDDVPVS